MNFSDELIEKAKSAKTPEELITMAKAEDMELTSDEANEYFAKLNKKSGEISDEELDNVSGGVCYRPDGRPVVSLSCTCEFFKCCICGRIGKKECDWDEEIGEHCKCGVRSTCRNCSYRSVESCLWLCNEPHNMHGYKE